jgi:hypothetical protein
MRGLGIALLVVGVILVGIFGIQGIIANYVWERDFGSYWSLAEKASTIQQKSEYMDKFVTALENSGLKGQSDALFLNTPDNSFDMNLSALKSLQKRLEDIKTMDISSFQYQTAIEQITKQEQGEAGKMISVLESCWWKVHQSNLWNIWVFLSFGIPVVLAVIGWLIFISSF